MKKIIDGKKYDTETAKCVCVMTNGYYSNDFNYEREELYLKKTGEYFIYGEGGARSKYNQQCGGNSYCGGSAITPVSKERAMEFVENYGSAEEYEELFGEVDE